MNGVDFFFALVIRFLRNSKLDEHSFILWAMGLFSGLFSGVDLPEDGGVLGLTLGNSWVGEALGSRGGVSLGSALAITLGSLGSTLVLGSRTSRGSVGGVFLLPSEVSSCFNLLLGGVLRPVMASSLWACDVLFRPSCGGAHWESKRRGTPTDTIISMSWARNAGVLARRNSRNKFLCSVFLNDRTLWSNNVGGGERICFWMISVTGCHRSRL